MADDRRNLQLEALQNILDKNRDKREKDYFSQKAGPDLSQNFAKGDLDKDVLKVKSRINPIEPEKSTIVGKTEKIDTRGTIQPQTSGKDFAKMQDEIALKQRLKSSFKAAAQAGDDQMMNNLRKIAQNMKKGAKTGLKSIPIIGSLAGLAGAVSSQDASAAIPLLDTAESLGPARGSLEAKLEAGTITPEERNMLRQQALANMVNIGKN